LADADEGAADVVGAARVGAGATGAGEEATGVVGAGADAVGLTAVVAGAWIAEEVGEEQASTDSTVRIHSSDHK